LTPGRIDLEHPAPAHFPLLLALQALDLGCAAHSHGLLTMIDELDVWHLGRLVRHPCCPATVPCCAGWVRPCPPPARTCR
jgi:hypothetical protein